jgi:hypothetical protein
LQFSQGCALRLPAVFFFCVFALVPSLLSAQTSGPIFVIRNINYVIDGRTKAATLERLGGFETDVRFTGQAELDAYLQKKKQDLYNIRAFDPEKNSITYTLGEREADGIVPVFLEVAVTDSSGFLAFPEPNYDSNYGFSLSLKFRDNNFLGTLSPQKLNFIWGADDRERNYLGYLLDVQLPFHAFGFDWTFTSFNELRYYLSGEPAFNKNMLGIAMELPISFTTATFGLEQGFVLHEENYVKAIEFDPEDGAYNSWYLYTRGYVDWKIPTPLRAGPFGAVVYTPGVYGIVRYQPGGDVGEFRRGPGLGIRQTLSLEKIDWIGNFRHGLRVSVLNDNEYNVHRGEWLNSVGFSGEGHIRVSRLFGISGRILYTKWFNDFYEHSGDVIRGYKDNMLLARERLTLNLDFPFSLIRFMPSEWTGNRKFRYFDFEQHWSLFLDLAMIESPEGSYRFEGDSFRSYSFKPDDIIAGTGLEIITFPLHWRSYYLRISAGWNLREWIETGSMPSGIFREIYMGLGHFF